MTLPTALNDREYQKFVDIAPGETAVRVSITGFLPLKYDRVDVTYPNDTQEIYAFTFRGNAAGSVTVNYVDATKEFIASVVKTDAV